MAEPEQKIPYVFQDQTKLKKESSYGSNDDKKLPALKAPPPGSMYCSAVKKEPKKKSPKKDRQCLICHRSTAECRLRMRKLSCGHQFCRACIDRWLETKDSCPYCRQKVSERPRQKVRAQNQKASVPAAA